jgi:phosphatidylserine/phosphatidylglycerophosphate/cardiolipin synthase-like enzyme
MFYENPFQTKYHSIIWLDPRRFNNRSHRKLLVIDGKIGFVGGGGIAEGAFVSVGSGNLDLRSIRLNDEANLNVLNRSFAAQQTPLFDADKRRSREITLNETGKLGFAHLPQQAASVIAPELLRSYS